MLVVKSIARTSCPASLTTYKVLLNTATSTGALSCASRPTPLTLPATPLPASTDTKQPAADAEGVAVNEGVADTEAPIGALCDGETVALGKAPMLGVGVGVGDSDGEGVWLTEA